MQEQPFSLSGDRYDQSQFLGRALKFFNIVDPRTLLPKLFFNQSLEEAQCNLDRYKQDPSAHSNFHELWDARKIVEAQVHPDTGERIPAPFRMSGFVPFGTPVIVGMLIAGSSPASNVFWQWLNQSHNAAINYCNRNASAPVSNQDLALSYGAAVSTAVVIKLSADKVIQRLNRPALGRFAPFLAVASANVLNVVMMRRAELSQGINVFDADKNVIGQSVVAAKKAITETAFTRVLLPIPILVASPLMLMGIERKLPRLMKNPVASVVVQASVVVMNFLVGLPLSMSSFKQTGEVAVQDMEPEFRDKLAGSTISLYYNKGL